MESRQRIVIQGFEGGSGSPGIQSTIASTWTGKNLLTCDSLRAQRGLRILQDAKALYHLILSTRRTARSFKLANRRVRAISEAESEPDLSTINRRSRIWIALFAV